MDIGFLHFLFPRLDRPRSWGLSAFLLLMMLVLLSLHFFVYDVSQIPAGLRVSS